MDKDRRTNTTVVRPDTLEEALRAPLPGERAHRTMIPRLSGRTITLPRGVTPRRSAVLILLVPSPTDCEPEIPLIQRTDDGGPHALQISLPGGRHEPGDRDATATAIREAGEEIGLSTEGMEVLGTLTPLYIDVSNFLVKPVVAWRHETNGCDFWNGLSPQPSEVLRIVRAPIRALASSRADRTVRARGYTLEAPSYRIGDDVVWGATATILAELFMITGLDTASARPLDRPIHHKAGGSKAQD